jgi:hypothetical protein
MTLDAPGPCGKQGWGAQTRMVLTKGEGSGLCIPSAVKGDRGRGKVDTVGEVRRVGGCSGDGRSERRPGLYTRGVRGQMQEGGTLSIEAY